MAYNKMIPPSRNTEAVRSATTSCISIVLHTFFLYSGDSSAVHRSPWPLSLPQHSPPHHVPPSNKYCFVKQSPHYCISLTQKPHPQPCVLPKHTHKRRSQPLTTIPEIRCHALASAASVTLLGEQTKHTKYRRNGIRRHPPLWRSPCRGTSSTHSSYQRPGVRHPQPHRPAMLPLLVSQLL